MTHARTTFSAAMPGTVAHRLALCLLMACLGGMPTAGCSIRRVAINKLGDALAGGGTTFASDEDPELVQAAVPFSLKLMESLLAESPRHRGLLLAACSGFTQYAYAFVQQEADEMRPVDFTASVRLKERAKLLYLRARNYGMRGLETSCRGFEQSLRARPKETVALAQRKDVPLLYWTAASWGMAISNAKDEPGLILDQPIVEALIDRALELDEAFDNGAVHSFLITYEMSRVGLPGDPAERSRKHFARAMQLAEGFQAGPLVSLAEAVSLERQDRREFESLLHQALAIDPNARPEYRLVNLVMQRRARWLLARADELFF